MLLRLREPLITLRALERRFAVGDEQVRALRQVSFQIDQGEYVSIVGPSGSGKSILAAAFLAQGARSGETGVVAAFEQHPNRSRNPTLVD